MARRTLSSRLLEAVNAATMLSAPAGVLLIVHRIGAATRLWLALALTWVGSGYLFGWGLWHMINVLGNTALVRAAHGMALVNLVSLVQFVAGLIIGVVMLLQLTERHARRQEASGQSPSA